MGVIRKLAGAKELEVRTVSLLYSLSFFCINLTLGDTRSFPGSSDGKESVCNAGDWGSIPGLGSSPEEWNGYALPYSLENSIHRGAWRTTVHGLTKSWTGVSD